MADPISAMAVVSMGASAGGAITSMLGSKRSAEASIRQNQYQAGVARTNAQIQRQNRDYALKAGEHEALRVGIKGAQQAGAIRAAQGASGLRVDSGSAKDVADSQRIATTMDLATVREKAARTAYGHEVQGWNAERQGDLYEQGAKNAQKAGKYAIMGSLMSGIGSVSSKWSQMGQSFGSAPEYGGWQGDSGYHGWIDQPGQRA